MTTVAYDGKNLCADSRSSLGDMIYEEDAQKIFPNIGPFSVLAIAGDYQDAMDIMESIKEFSNLDHIRSIPKEEMGDAQLIGITHDGELWSYAGSHSCKLRADMPIAIGSGRQFALAAMDLGKSAEEAIIYASSRDMFTNNVVQTIEIASLDDMEEHD